MRRAAIGLVAALYCGLGLPTPAVAALSTFSNPAAFSSDATLLTFDGTGLGSSTAFRSLGGVGFALLTTGTQTDTGLGPTMASAPNSSIPRAFAPFDGPFFLNTINPAGAFDQDLRITLPALVRAMGFELTGGGGFGVPDSLTFEVFAGATRVGTLGGGTSNPRSFVFYGIASTLAFDTLVIRQTPDTRFLLENLRYGSLGPATEVPAPGPLPILLLGLVALGVVRRRRA